MTEQRDELLREAYQGEVFGEAFFGALADRERDAARLEKLRALQAIEAGTAGVLRAYAAREGVDTGDDDKSRRDGEALAGPAAEGGWDVFVRGLHDALPSFLAGFVRLRELSADPHDPALVTLVAHELAINAFAELELAGYADLSGAVLHRYREGARESVR